jgi:hypothetical protein
MRAKSVAALREYLVERGYIDEREVLGAGEVASMARARLVGWIEDGSLDAQEVRGAVDWVEALDPAAG